ncbi:hypothetical protein BO85DRAFT_49931 [Aspergillus piperis CBS 112811]|uniref:Uncharacterized protein n=1 Tax=Aspergillus piperis CBS 112811 TaxID=1448313 RepID=A0A8G1VN77_9EURO|nr:hypothetical protein BO85DRAFT_49931 [Aspergillus piperis CBS 112811]RAH56438.1 hypothetical protein BO85DRAFT_49931 [Aspergillus piperis CBS 112811]
MVREEDLRVFRIFELLFMSVLSFSPYSLTMKSYMRSDYQQAARHHLILSGWLLKTRCVQDSSSLFQVTGVVQFFSPGEANMSLSSFALKEGRGISFAESFDIDGPHDNMTDRQAYNPSVTQRVSLPCSYRTCHSSKSMYVNFPISNM